MRAQPYKIELLKSGLMALCGLLLVLQPWVGLLRGVGWVLLLAGGILFLALLLKVSAAKRVLREPLASFACGRWSAAGACCSKGKYTTFPPSARM